MPTTANIDSGDYQIINGLSASAFDAYLVPPMDVSQYQWISLCIGPDAYSGLLSFLISFDQSNWIACQMYNLTTLDGGESTYTTSATNTVTGMPVIAPYFAVRMTSYTSGTATGTLQLNRHAPSGVPLLISATRLMPAKNDIGYTLNDGNNAATIAAGTSTPTVISNVGGMLVRVLVTTAGSAQMTFYDNASAASGTIIGIIPSTATVNGVPFEFHSPCALGIVASGDAGNPAVSVFFSA